MKTHVTRRMPFVVATGLLLAVWLTASPAVLAEAPENQAKGADAAVKYRNYIGYEGIATLGGGAYTNGPTPPVADWVTTHCRYLNVQNTAAGHFYLRYPIHVPDGAVITGVTLYLADFNPNGVMWAYLRSRLWNSRDAGTTHAFTLTDNSSSNDKQVNMGFLDVPVDNATKVYWVDVTPQNSSNPGELCVYGIHVSYDCSRCFLLFEDGFESGNTSAWSSTTQ